MSSGTFLYVFVKGAVTIDMTLHATCPFNTMNHVRLIFSHKATDSRAFLPAAGGGCTSASRAGHLMIRRLVV